MVMANFGHLVAFKKAVLGWHKAENMRRSVLHMLMLWGIQENDVVGNTGEWLLPHRSAQEI